MVKVKNHPRLATPMSPLDAVFGGRVLGSAAYLAPMGKWVLVRPTSLGTVHANGAR
jgi:hypothetical protein